MSNCIFCKNYQNGNYVMENETAIAFSDKYPVTDGHHLLVPKRHVSDWFLLTMKEKRDIELLLQKIRKKIISHDATVVGFNIGMNCGIPAGQTVMHAHVHVIPRRDGDLADPSGGVRGVIPHKMKYESSHE